MTVSTHTDLSKWETKETYDAYKRELHDKMLSVIEGTYPGFSESIVDQYPGAPRAWERFTGRPDGMVGDIRRRRKMPSSTACHTVPL
ncbi:hypothetical protein ACPJHQ_14545 [Rossellomorea sp. H39__3]